MTVGRFAPSPSGRMHLGNVFSALLSWLSVRKHGGKWILRIEDLDPGRSKEEFARFIEDDLLWLGLEWDEGGLEEKGPNGPYRQSLRHDKYEEALKMIEDKGLTFPCFCSRADIMAANAPHAGDNRKIYPGLCLPSRFGGKFDPPREKLEEKHSVRIHLPDINLDFNDRIFGDRSVNLAEEFGDLVLRRADGSWAYQLAVVVDDALMGVTEVVRGADLLSSVAPQIFLYRSLGFKEPQFMHVPLICNSAGKRLSKRDKDLSMEIIRKEFTPSALTGYLAFLAGILPEPFPISPQGLLPLYHSSAIKAVAAIRV